MRPCSGHWGHSNAQEQSPCPHRADIMVGEAGNTSKILSLANKARDCPALPFVSCSIVHSISGHGSQMSHTLGLCTCRSLSSSVNSYSPFGSSSVTSSGEPSLTFPKGWSLLYLHITNAYFSVIVPGRL